MKKYLAYIIIGFFVIMGFKSCIKTLIKIDDYILLEKSFESGQNDRVILTPQFEMIHVKKLQDITEIGIYSIKGYEATHYLFDLYNIGRFPLGLKYYNKAESVFEVEFKLKNKLGDSFPKVGKSFNSKIIIFDNNVIIDKLTYKRISLEESEKTELKNSIKLLKSSIK
ncbi:MAG: hypothetical protein HQ543_04190 [Bacteroidetes bacterium]|nr:hypothetical protein [Bacteroidota bacterium]